MLKILLIFSLYSLPYLNIFFFPAQNAQILIKIDRPTVFFQCKIYSHKIYSILALEIYFFVHVLFIFISAIRALSRTKFCAIFQNFCYPYFCLISSSFFPLLLATYYPILGINKFKQQSRKLSSPKAWPNSLFRSTFEVLFNFLQRCGRHKIRFKLTTARRSN